MFIVLVHIKKKQYRLHKKTHKNERNPQNNDLHEIDKQGRQLCINRPNFAIESSSFFELRKRKTHRRQTNAAKSQMNQNKFVFEKNKNCQNGYAKDAFENFLFDKLYGFVCRLRKFSRCLLFAFVRFLVLSEWCRFGLERSLECWLFGSFLYLIWSKYVSSMKKVSSLLWLFRFFWCYFMA